MNTKFNPTTRKALAAALGDILGEKPRYAGMPSAAYQIADYTLYKDGTLAGPELFGLLTKLAERGFLPESEPEKAVEPAPEPEPPAIDQVCIEFPCENMTDEAIENLRRMVAAKAPLIKMALGIDEMPIEVEEDRLCFDWFAADNDHGQIDCWAQFIACLCKTAMTKKRVTAQEREFTNPRYQMRCFCLALGMIGSNYAATRRLLIANLPGNSGWLNGPPEKALGESNAEEHEVPINE